MTDTEANIKQSHKITRELRRILAQQVEIENKLRRHDELLALVLLQIGSQTPRQINR